MFLNISVNDIHVFKAFFTPEEEAARRKASLAKSEDIFRGQDHSNLKGVFKQNPAKVNTNQAKLMRVYILKM